MPPALQTKTQSHYDEYPFIEGGENRVAWWREYLRDFLPDQHLRDALVLDVGSSVGEISRGLADRGARMVCLDISLQSLRRCREVNPGAEVFNASALGLPFADDSFDHVISIGVLHHTPDCRLGFSEAARVTAPGGTVVIFLYNYWNIYNLIFHLFAPVRRHVPLAAVPTWVTGLLQPFARTHLGQPLSDEQLRRLLGDKLWTPRATFHTVREVRRWGTEEGLVFTDNKRFYLGYANVMRFVKRGRRDGSRRREIRAKCRGCASPMDRVADGWICPTCGRRYAAAAGIFRCLDVA
jgi:SAM-dependent methyltransferase